jgi:thiamine pyrophosphokinase
MPESVTPSPAEGFLLPDSTRTIVIANGSLADLETARRQIRPGDFLIAADGGSVHFRRLGLRPHLLIGDLDSTSPGEAAELEAAGVQVLRYPARKDQTDLELALDWAARHRPGEIIVLGALGGRWDQTLANVLLPALPAFKGLTLRLLDDAQTIITLRGPGVIHLSGMPGDIVSLIPIGGPVTGITTAGLEYPLVDGAIDFGSTLGISNVLTAPEAVVTIQTGWLVCILIAAP